MDDLWGNAWGESPKKDDKKPLPLPEQLGRESLVNPSVGDALVWHATEPPVNWEPEIQPKASVWGEDQSPWGGATDPSQLGSGEMRDSPVSSPEPELAPGLPPSSPKVEVGTPSPEQEESVSGFQPPSELVIEDFNPSFAPHSPVSPRAISPDGFGSFETGQDNQIGEAGWVSPRVVEKATEDPGWGEQRSNEPEPPKDAWAAAQEEQMRRNKKVPPALIDALLEQWKSFEGELWPSDTPHTRSWDRDRIEDTETINRLVEKFLPPLSLAPPVAFGTTTVQKSLATTIKLTKSYKLAITSPLAHMRPSSGSDAWERHVKTFTEIDPAQLDQWAVDAAKPPEPILEDKPKTSVSDKKAAGWSFWGKKQSSTSAPPRPASASGIKSKTSSPASSARPSVDVSIAAPKPIEAPVAIMPAVPSVVPPVMTKSPPLVEPAKLDDSFNEPPPQPSAVSRFFSRISRNKSSEVPTKVNNLHSSFLSSTDIDFLSDVPSYNEEDGEKGLASLEAMLSTSPPKGSKGPIPPLLAPPPKLNPPPRISASPPPVRHPRALSLDAVPTAEDDFMDFLSAPTEAVSPKIPAPSNTFLHTLPSPLSPSSGSSNGARTPGPSQQAFPLPQTRTSTMSPFSQNRSLGTPPPIKQVKSDFGSLMNFGASPPLHSPPPPIPPSKFQPHDPVTDVGNDDLDDFDSFVSGPGDHDDSFNSFTDASFAGSTASHDSHDTEERHLDQVNDSFEKDVALFLDGGKPSNSVTIPHARNRPSNDFSDFSDFLGGSSKSGSFSPPPRPPSKPSTPNVRQAQTNTRPSVVKLGATRVTMSSAPKRASTSSPAPLLPPPPGSTAHPRRTESMIDDTVESPTATYSFPPINSNGQRMASTGAVPILPSPNPNGSTPILSAANPMILGPGFNNFPSLTSMTSVHPSVGMNGFRPSSTSNVSTLPQPSSGTMASNHFGSSSSSPPALFGSGKATSPPLPLITPSLTIKAPTSGSGTKGLSAQDLSFFEGL